MWQERGWDRLPAAVDRDPLCSTVATIFSLCCVIAGFTGFFLYKKMCVWCVVLGKLQGRRATTTKKRIVHIARPRVAEL